MSMRRRNLTVVFLAFVVVASGLALAGSRGPETRTRAARLAFPPAPAGDDLLVSSNPFDQFVANATLAALEERLKEGLPPGCLETPKAAVCLSPYTEPERIPALLEFLRTFYEGQLGAQKYQKVDRIGFTAMDGATGSDGDPIHVTWSIVPDGTLIDGGISNLNAVFDAGFAGGHATWIQQMRDAFARWSARTGIDYVEEVDDGAQHPINDGSVGIRGDVRIGGRNIDGPNGVLAYDFYPSGGSDMVLDTGDIGNFANNFINYRFFRNVVMHEHGHGQGLAHVDPTNQTKLMEAFASTNFNGPQDDDIRGSQKNYGDQYEQNDDSLSAYFLGAVADTVRPQFVSLDKGGDADWYKLHSAPGMNTISITLDAIGSTYLQGPQGGATAFVMTDSILNLAFGIYDASGATLTIVDNVGLGGTETISNFSIPGNGDVDILVKVFRTGSGGPNVIQRYDLFIQLGSSPLVGVDPAVAGAPDRMNLAIAPNPIRDAARVQFRAAGTSPYSLDVFDLSGRLVRRFEGRAPAGGLAEIAWDGRDADGARVASGVYMLRAAAGTLTETQRAVVLR